MLNHWSRAPKSHGLGRFRDSMDAVAPVASVVRAVLRRRPPGSRAGEAAGGILRLAVILAAVCAYLLLLDHLGVRPAATMDFPFID